MELPSIEKLAEDGSVLYRDDFKVSIYENRIFTAASFCTYTIPKLIADMKKFHERSHKNKHRPLVIGFGADIEIQRWVYREKGDEQIYDTLTVCVDSQCLMVIISAIITSKRWIKHFPISLRELLTDSNTILVGLGIEKIAKKFEKDFGFSLGKTVDLKSLAIEGLLRDGPAADDDDDDDDDKQELLNEEERRRKLRRCPLDDLLNKALGRKWKIRRETKKIEMWTGPYDNLHEDRVKASTLDAFVAWKIGTKYLDLIKTKFLV